jgi:hypothetical protein
VRAPLAAGPAPLPFVALPPCRVVDTRGNAPLSGGFLPPATVRSYTVMGVCGIPANAQAVSLNATVVNPTGPGFLILYSQGGTFPPVSTLNFLGNDIVANAAVVPISASGGLSMVLGVSGGDVILDANGYYAPVSSVTSLNSISGDVSFSAGSNLTLTPFGNTLTVNTAPTITANLNGNVTGNISGTLSGTATGFSGPLLGDVTGSQGATIVSSVGGQTAASVAAGTSLANAATSANAPNALVRRDGAGSFIANVVTATGGVLGTSAGSVGVKGVSTSYNGVWAESTSQDALFASGGRDGAFVTGGRHGVGGVSTGSAGILYGVWGSNASPAAGAAGVSGTAGSAPTNFNLAVGDAAGVLGVSFGHIGVAGVGTGFFAPAGKFVSADPGTGAAVSVVNLGFGTHAAEFAGNVFVYTFQPGSGNLSVQGMLSKGAGSFKIDHPLDPENKYLYHSFVESPDMMNIYNGNAILDDSGEAIVQLPAYFEALNGDFRYQLTPIGRHAPVFVADEISGNRFRIAGGRPGMKVSWQVTGIRKDPFAIAHRIIPEVEKEPEMKGYFLHAAESGQPDEKSLGARAIKLKRAEAASGAPEKGR